MRNDETKLACEAYLKLALHKDGGKYAHLVLALLGVIIEGDPRLAYLQGLVKDADEGATLRAAQRNIAVAGGTPPWMYDLIQRVTDK